jgi:hypothetical protein
MIKTIDTIPFNLDIDTIFKRSSMDSSMCDIHQVELLIETALRCGKPKVIIKECLVDAVGKDGTDVRVDSVVFKSRIMRANLTDVDRVVAYIATCGREFDEITISGSDPMVKYLLDTIKGIALQYAIDQLHAHIRSIEGFGSFASMNPGSGDAAIWPIEQQRELFSLFGNVEERIGVHLTESFLMLPNKTVSGIIFPSVVEYHNCQVCHKENCPSRKVPFDPELWKTVEVK